METLTPLCPVNHRIVPKEIPSPIREAMEDASAALGAGSVIGSMLAARTAIIRALRQSQLALTTRPHGPAGAFVLSVPAVGLSLLSRIASRAGQATGSRPIPRASHRTGKSSQTLWTRLAASGFFSGSPSGPGGHPLKADGSSRRYKQDHTRLAQILIEEVRGRAR